ncbi:MAG: hypothetical protein AAF790_05290 [Planctomycetota bacterium]
MLALVAVTAVGCGGRLAYNLPPAQQIQHPGPGVGGPGPGVIPVGNQMTMGAPGGGPFYGPGGSTPGCGPMGGGCGPGGCDIAGVPGAPASAGGGIQPVQYCEGGAGGPGGCYGGAGGMMGPPTTSQIAFVGEEGLQVSWSVSGGGVFDSAPLVVPSRQDFPQGAIYRLKLSNIPGRPSVMLYPTLEVAPVTPRTDAYLAHAPVPVQFTEEDFDQVLSGNFVTKVVYLPDPEFQELALAGVETLVSTRLDPGCDPVAEADKRGSILAIIRIGNKNLETGGQPTYEGGVLPAEYTGEDMPSPADYAQPEAPDDRAAQMQYCPDGSCDIQMGGPTMGGPMMAGPGMGGPVPAGMPTSGFAPQPVPPHMIAGTQYGLPITGTPIGLPGPPHIPHGVPAGLKRHAMTNRTRMAIPGPTKHVNISVKQRPGMNYPAPVNRVHIDETHRAPFRLFGGTLAGPLSLLKKKGDSCPADCE